MTHAESILWKHLRGRRFAGFKFRRRHPIGPFFADLACHECKVIIEVDGVSHLGQKYRDERRSDYLREYGWLVLRFWNTEVYDELESVLEAIYQTCERRK
jgi:very-short-patch-repair endonuclease